MPLEALARRLARGGPVPPHALPLNVRFADAAGAIAAGMRTREGAAHARAYGDRTSAGALAAVVRLTELDDIDLRTCTTPSAVVVPVVLDAAFRRGASPEMLERGLHAGYHAVARAGLAAGGIEALGRGVWPTLLVAPFGAAATAGALRALDAERMLAALRLALMRSSGKAGGFVPPFPSRWWLFGESVAAGIAAADAAAAGFTADAHFDGVLSEAADTDPFGTALADDDCGWISQKTFPTARQGANATTAFGDLLRDHALDPGRIRSVRVEVPPPCVRVISTPVDPENRLSLIANVGFAFGLTAFAPRLMPDPDRAGPFPAEAFALARRVTIEPSADLAAAFPREWGARVTLELDDGTRYERTRATIPGDPAHPLTLDGVKAKYPQLDAAFFDDAAAALRDPAALARTLTRLRG